jgi:hypothetical protein
MTKAFTPSIPKSQREREGNPYRLTRFVTVCRLTSKSPRQQLQRAIGLRLTNLRRHRRNPTQLRQSLAYVYGHADKRDAETAKGLTLDEAAHSEQHRQAAKLTRQGGFRHYCVVIDTERCGGSTVSSLICGEV